MDRRTVLKFGGRSLENGKGIDQVLTIIANKVNNREFPVVVLSARGKTTDHLEKVLQLSSQKETIQSTWDNLKKYQLEPSSEVNFKEEFGLLEDIFEGVRLIGDYSLKTKDLVLAQGEILSVKLVSHMLNRRGIKSRWVDSRDCFVTDSEFGHASLLIPESEQRTQDLFDNFPKDLVPVFTGFIGRDQEGVTTTLGRNGSNYSASMLACFLNAGTIESYTHLDGIFTANPDEIEDAGIINRLSFQEASEMASFGASILHPKTIAPLVDAKIPMQILNTFHPEQPGTLISHNGSDHRVKSIAVQRDVCVINIEGNGLLGRIGVDGRIFSVMSSMNMNVGVISQGSSERGVGFVIDKRHARNAVKALQQEFDKEIDNHFIQSITSVEDVAVVTLIGQDLKNFHPALQAINSNNIPILLISNNIKGNNISLVIPEKNVVEATHIFHSQIFGMAKKINIAIFGKGNVGGCLIDQVLKNQSQILRRKGLLLNVFAIVGKSQMILNRKGIDKNWRAMLSTATKNISGAEQVIRFARENHLENLVLIDNTASLSLTEQYAQFVKNGFDLISSNKIANTQDFNKYYTLRKTLQKYNREYLYETNVGAGLPLIDTIKLLHGSGENITRIRGVFSGSLSYIFNRYSGSQETFSNILREAKSQGLTEPDPREDLSGQDVARKLIILARELELENELRDVKIHNLIPESMWDIQTNSFLDRLEELDTLFRKYKEKAKKDTVLRYVGELYGNLQKSKGKLKAGLNSVPISSVLGQLSGSDSIFEIFTDSYGDHPIVIQGAGAGSEVTARGVFGDLLRIAERR